MKKIHSFFKNKFSPRFKLVLVRGGGGGGGERKRVHRYTVYRYWHFLALTYSFCDKS